MTGEVYCGSSAPPVDPTDRTAARATGSSATSRATMCPETGGAAAAGAEACGKTPRVKRAIRTARRRRRRTGEFPSSFFLATVPNARVDILAHNGGRVYGKRAGRDPVTGERKYQRGSERLQAHHRRLEPEVGPEEQVGSHLDRPIRARELHRHDVADVAGCLVADVGREQRADVDAAVVEDRA